MYSVMCFKILFGSNINDLYLLVARMIYDSIFFNNYVSFCFQCLVHFDFIIGIHYVLYYLLKKCRDVDFFINKGCGTVL